MNPTLNPHPPGFNVVGGSMLNIPGGKIPAPPRPATLVNGPPYI